MCVGPIRIAVPGTQTDEDFSRDMVLVLSSDFFLTDPVRPYLASPNEYDFYFLALNDLPALTRMSFWFPFQTEPLPMRAGASLPGRRQWLADWGCRSFQTAVGLRRPEDTRSFNWNLKSTAASLHFSHPESVLDTLHSAIDQIQSGRFIDEHELVTFEAVPLAEGSQYAGRQQHHLVTTRRKIHRGEIVHIWFEADMSLADPVNNHPRSGDALLHYYDPTFDTIEFPWVDHPIRQAPVVPCVMQHVVLLFPHRVKVEPEIRPHENMVFSGDNHTLQLPDFPDQAVNDWRELVIFNAHLIEQQRDFHIRWTYQIDDEMPLNGLSPRIKSVLEEIGADAQEVAVVENAVRRLYSPVRSHTLTPREWEIARLKARLTLRNRDIADMLNTSPGNIEEHLRRIYGKLAFEDIANSRKARLLRAVVETIEPLA